VQKIRQHPQAGPAALFKMELGGHQVFLADDRGEAEAVVRGGQHAGRIVGDGIIAVHKVKFVLRANPRQKRVIGPGYGCGSIPCVEF